MPELNLNGYTILPAGKIAAVVTYLEMTSPDGLEAADAPCGLTLERQSTIDAGLYRSLFTRIGEPWLWFSRLNLSDENLIEILTSPSTDLWFLMLDGEPKGMLEADRSRWPDIEIVYFGVVPELVGRGAGSWLMRACLARIWAQSPSRIWLHTCTLDHPLAVRFYIKHGFRPYLRGIEVADDPRLTGKLSPRAAPDVPVL
jgi:GNAT superfamily N-acetyltransferase